MAFQPLFCDSFDHYDTAGLIQKYTGVSGVPSIDATGTLSRTGLGCCVLNSAGGPQRAVGQQPNLIVGHAINPPGLTGGGVYGNTFIWFDTTAGTIQITACTKADGSISLLVGNPPFAGLLGTSAPNLVQVGVYNYLEYAIIFAPAPDGIAYVRVNGQLVLTITGANTSFSGHLWADLVQLSGVPPPLSTGTIHDDLYVGYSDSPATIQNDFLGPVRIYPFIPSANKSPLNFTPLANTNWQEVSVIPEPGDAAYVFDGNIGDADQYEMQPVSGQAPSGSYSIPFGQTVMSAKLDAAGAATIASDIVGNLGASVAVTTGYKMYPQPIKNNPATAAPFEPIDFTTGTWMGPKVTG